MAKPRLTVLIACIVAGIAACVVGFEALRTFVETLSIPEGAGERGPSALADLLLVLVPCIVVALVVGIVWFLASRPSIKVLSDSEQAATGEPPGRRAPLGELRLLVLVVCIVAAVAVLVVGFEVYRAGAEALSVAERTGIREPFERRAQIAKQPLLVWGACIVVAALGGAVWFLAYRSAIEALSASEQAGIRERIARRARIAKRTLALLMACVMFALVVGVVWFLASWRSVRPLSASEQARIREPFERREPEATNSIGMRFRLIPAGQFMMGEGEYGDPREEPVHRVTISRPFYLGIHEVTQAQYEQVMSSNRSDFQGPNQPVEMVSWDDAQEFCRRLSVREGVEYRLPTEAEWEYACRAGSTTVYFFGDNPHDFSPGRLDEYAWYCYNSGVPRRYSDRNHRTWVASVRGERTHDVGQKKPNAWGLYDMYGNVSEWCQDWYAEYTGEAQTDPRGPAKRRTGLQGRVVRNGSWRCNGDRCRSACRYGWDPARGSPKIGFRVARPLP